MTPWLCPHLSFLLPAPLFLLVLILWGEVEFSLRVGKSPMFFFFFLFLFWFIFPKLVSMLGFKFFHALFCWWEQDAQTGERGCWWQGATAAEWNGEVLLLFPASPWTLGSSSFSLAGCDSGSSAFLFLGEELSQELVKSKGFEPYSLWESGCVGETLRNWQKRPKSWQERQKSWQKSPDEGDG